MTLRASLLAAALVLCTSALPAQELGTITFPTSGTPAAQALFIKGVVLLHSFEYGDARDMFVAAQKAEPGFAMAYWGEAMTFNHPLWEETAPDLARAALARLAATPQARLAKAPTTREKDWLGAVERLYAAGDKHARDVAYADAMKRMLDKYPDDPEVKAFCALALMGTGRDTAAYMKAAGIAEQVYATNPAHPGASHYLIHAFDDPEHAEQGLRFADAYASIAPGSAHGLHMPSHIYAALGLWDRASAVNERSMAAADARRNEKALDVDERGFHAMWWLVYSYAQQGRIEAARGVLAQIDAAARETGSMRTRTHLALARAAFLIETRKWVEASAPVDATDLPREAIAADLFAIGFAGVRSGNRAMAAGAMQRMASLMQDAPENLAPVRTSPSSGSSRPGIAPIAPGPKAVPQPGISPIKPDAPTATPPAAAGRPGGDARIPQVMAQQLEAAILFAEGRRDEAVVLARQAAVVESLLPAESGPPNPVKPVFEQVGEMLMDLRRPKEAMEAFQLSLKRAPKRALSLLGLARAATLAREPAVALAAYSDLREAWKAADPTLPELKEVTAALASRPSSR